jgi:CBS domain-containing protein
MNYDEEFSPPTGWEGSTAYPILTQSSGADQALLRSLARRRPPVVPPEATLRETLYQISQRQEDAAVVVDPASGLPLGLVTLRDMLHTISSQAISLDEPVAAHMIGAPLTIAADSPAHRAKVLMTKRGATHLLLIEGDGRLFGLVGQADLMGLRAGGAEALIETIGDAKDLEAMTQATNQVQHRGTELFRSGMGVETLCQWMSGLHDLITMRVIELQEDGFDLPVVPWCWLVFGSAGRLEQTFVPEQVNGLIFVPPEPAATEALRAAFLPFALAVNQALQGCGFAYHHDHIMAGNPRWCLSAEEWRLRFVDWLRGQPPEGLTHRTPFLDLRPLYGSFEPADQLHAWLLAEARSAGRFLRNLTEQALSVSPPLGWAGHFNYDHNLDFPHTIDIKLQGSRLFIDAARVWALKHGIWATNTAERLRAAGNYQELSIAEVASEIEAFHVIQRFRINQRLQTHDPNASNRLDPYDLKEMHRLSLKEAFHQAQRIQERLRQQFPS